MARDRYCRRCSRKLGSRVSKAIGLCAFCDSWPVGKHRAEEHEVHVVHRPKLNRRHCLVCGKVLDAKTPSPVRFCEEHNLVLYTGRRMPMSTVIAYHLRGEA